MSARHDSVPGQKNSDIPEAFRRRLLGPHCDDFSRRAGEVLADLSERLAGGRGSNTAMPARLGAYLVGPRIGRGGMSAVFRGVHVKTGRVVALKAVAADSVDAASLRAEALALGGLDHRGIVQVFDQGEDSGVVWMAVQFISGNTLSDLIRKRWNPDHGSAPPMSIEERRTFLTWFRDTAAALQAMHGRGLVHRDIKPANLMIDDEGVPFVIDFGLSLDVADHAVVDSLAGTIPYMSPEQVLAHTELDGRSDVYSLAATFYELFSGRRLVNIGERCVGVLREIAFGAPARLSAVAPWVPRSHDCVFAKALAKDPAKRYRTARELAADLDCLLAGRQPMHVHESVWSRLSRRRLLLAGTASLLAAGSWFGWNWLDRRSELEGFRAMCATASQDVDAQIRALNRAVELEPALGSSREFRDVYGKALADMAPSITRVMFQQAALVPTNAADATPAGRLGVTAERHLATNVEMSAGTRIELVVQAMFAHIRAQRYAQALAARVRCGPCSEERIELLESIACTLSGQSVDSSAIEHVRSTGYANLSIDKLCCRAFLMLELAGRSTGPTQPDLRIMGDALEREVRAGRAEGATSNLLAGLLALTHLELDDPERAAAVIDSRLIATTGPVPEERPAMTILGAAVVFRREMKAEHFDRSQFERVAEQFLAATQAQPQLVSRFVTDVLRGMPEGDGRDSALNHSCAAFFEALLEQNPRPEVFTESLLCLAYAAEQEWHARNEWRCLCEIVDRLAKSSGKARLDGWSGDRMNRNLWLAAIHVAGNSDYCTGRTSPDLQLCQTYRDAAVRMLSPPHEEFEAALARELARAAPKDAERARSLERWAAALRGRIDFAKAQGSDCELITLLEEELITVQVPPDNEASGVRK